MGGGKGLKGRNWVRRTEDKVVVGGSVEECKEKAEGGGSGWNRGLVDEERVEGRETAEGEEGDWRKCRLWVGVREKGGLGDGLAHSSGGYRGGGGMGSP